MRHFSELDEAEIRLEMRQIYRELGFTESLVVLLEIVTSAAILAEVIAEERNGDQADKRK